MAHKPESETKYQFAHSGFRFQHKDKIIMEKQINVYREETLELLAELESSMLELEESPDDAELIDRVFRAMHTIKGSGAILLN